MSDDDDDEQEDDETEKKSSKTKKKKWKNYVMNFQCGEKNIQETFSVLESIQFII